ncbi:MAG: aquaporin [Candidatus Saccharimonadales bacterium]
MFGKRQVATLVAEFLGTSALTLLILSVQRSTIGVPFFVAIAAGLTVTLMVFAVGRVSGGYFNPALVIGMWTARKINTVTSVLYIIAQMLGAWAAYGLYTYYVNNTLQPVGGDFSGRVLTAEIIGTAIFAFAVAAAVYQRAKIGLFAAMAGLGLTIGIVSASAASLGLLNPAVAFGIRAWVLGTYVLGPIIGAVIGVQLYSLLFADTAVAEEEAMESKTVAAKTSAPATKAKAKKAPAKKKPAAKKKK